MIESMKERLDQLDETEDELRELQVENACIRERLTNLERGNCDLHTNTESVTKRLSELQNGQPEAIEAAKESMKTLLDQKVTDIISECRSSQKKSEEENTLLKEAVAGLQKKLEEANTNNASQVSKLYRCMQAVYSEMKAVKGKQPLTPVTRPPYQPNSQNQKAPAVTAISQFPTQREPGKEKTDVPHLIKRRNPVLSSGNASLKKTRIEEADKCKYVMFKKGY